MEQAYRPPNILHLTGITMKHYQSMEDIFDRQILDSVEKKPDIITKKYDTIPKVFTTIKHWPKKTNLKCWMCDFFFEGAPKFVPTYIKGAANGRTKRNAAEYSPEESIEVGVLGVMCSFACASLYINTYFHRKEQAWKLLDNLSLLYRLFSGRSVHYIPIAPHKTTMVQYGGTVSETDFRKQIQEIEKQVYNKLSM
jgi:hypothetical protein